jgi:carbamoyl-phosphate synthase small subunit
VLELSSGDRFQGDMIGAPLVSSGELVFTTGMVGYSEAITDPSYFGQVIVFAYPLIGNYGIPELPKNIDFSKSLPKGFEGPKPRAAAVIVNTDISKTFHWNSFQSLDKWLLEQGIPGIAGIDTRHLVHIVRSSSGPLLAKVIPEESEGTSSYGEKFSLNSDGFFDPSKHEIVPEVSTRERLIMGKGKVRIALLDCGVKWNMIRQLLSLDCEIELLPWDTDLKKVDSSGWILSNGPGDPLKTGQLVNSVKALLEEKKPILGICLGHQILALASGARTQKMTYGHRSHNQPVYITGTRKGFITSQNHGYMVEKNSLKEGWAPWFLNVNDQTIEGIKHETLPFRSVQFHPESAGGPRDTKWVLDQFVEEVKAKKCHC